MTGFDPRLRGGGDARVFMTMRKKRKCLILREPGAMDLKTGGLCRTLSEKASFLQHVVARANLTGFYQQI